MVRQAREGSRPDLGLSYRSDHGLEWAEVGTVAVDRNDARAHDKVLPIARDGDAHPLADVEPTLTAAVLVRVASRLVGVADLRVTRAARSSRQRDRSRTVGTCAGPGIDHQQDRDQREDSCDSCHARTIRLSGSRQGAGGSEAGGSERTQADTRLFLRGHVSPARRRNHSAHAGKRVRRIELPSSAWKADALPLSYTRRSRSWIGISRPMLAIESLSTARGLEALPAKESGCPASGAQAMER